MSGPHEPQTICRFCGKETRASSLFCVHCGRRLQDAARGSAPPAPAPSSPVPPPTSPQFAPPVPAPGGRGRGRVAVIAAGVAAAVVLIGVVVARSGTDEPAPTASAAVRTAAPTAEPAPAPSLDGTWTSNYGPVTLDHDEATGQVTGSWVQEPDKTGQITSGRFDASARTLHIEYHEPWSTANGTADFALSADGRTLEGTYTQPGNSGSWVLQR